MMSVFWRSLGLALMLGAPLAVVLVSRWHERRWPDPRPETAPTLARLRDLVCGTIGVAWLASGAVWALLGLALMLAPVLALLWLVAQ